MTPGQLLARESRFALENWCRANASSVYLGDHKVLCRVLGKYKMLVDTRDLSLAPHLMLDGFWEMWITQAVARHVRPGMRCADVGANWGYYTLLLSDIVGQKGHVQAWEPRAEIVALLRASLNLNGCDNTNVVEGAATDRVGVAQLQLERPESGYGEFFGSARLMAAPSGEHVEVKTAPLDSGGAFDFVKIDAEGAEPSIWRGMQKILENPKVVVLMEFCPRFTSEAEGLLDDIVRRGFPLRRVGTESNIESVTREQAMQESWQMLWLER